MCLFMFLRARALSLQLYLFNGGSVCVHFSLGCPHLAYVWECCECVCVWIFVHTCCECGSWTEQACGYGRSVCPVLSGWASPEGTLPGACVGACCVYSSLSWGPALGCPQFCRTQGKAFDIAIGQVRFPPAAHLLVSAACVHSAVAGGTSVVVDRSPQGRGGGVRPESQEAPVGGGGKGPHGGRGRPATRLAPVALSHSLVSGGLESLRSAQLGRADNGQALLLVPVSLAAAPTPLPCRAPHHSSLGPCCLPQQGLRDPGLLVGCFYKCPGIT